MEDQISQIKSNLPGYKFSNLSDAERKARIDYLWGKLRTHVFARKFVFKTNKSLDENFLAQFSQLEKYDAEKIVEE